nr:hypothetical protein [Kutzneria chonburiensis]
MGAAGGEDGGATVQGLLVVVLEGGVEQGLLAVEVVVDGAGTDAGSRRDVGEPQVLDAGGSDLGAGGGQDLSPALGRDARTRHGHSSRWV